MTSFDHTDRKNGSGVFAESTGIDMNVTTIRGVQYIVFSFFDGDKSVTDRVGSLIQASFEASTAEEITNESLVDSGIAFPEE